MDEPFSRMQDPAKRAERYEKVAEEFAELAKDASSPFLRACQSAPKFARVNFARRITPTFSHVLYAVYAVYCVGVVRVLLLTGKGARAIVIDGSLLLISMLLLSPMTSQSHHIALVLPVFAIVAVFLKGDRSTRRTAGVLLIAYDGMLMVRATCEGCMSIDVRRWHRQGLLRAGHNTLGIP
jgi:hypothetical protein